MTKGRNDDRQMSFVSGEHDLLLHIPMELGQRGGGESVIVPDSLVNNNRRRTMTCRSPSPSPEHTSGRNCSIPASADPSVRWRRISESATPTWPGYSGGPSLPQISSSPSSTAVSLMACLRRSLRERSRLSGRNSARDGYILSHDSPGAMVSCSVSSNSVCCHGARRASAVRSVTDLATSVNIWASSAVDSSASCRGLRSLSPLVTPPMRRLTS